ncbi:MAG: DUF4303 domain-containing protein [Pirellulaceae bacterium]|nr:DUF4303 domain-containing protein [Pirellulaceae bacterium]
MRKWLAQPRTALVAAVADGVREHIAALRSGGAEFYGYALIPGEPYDINNLVAATNGEADIKVPPDDDQYRYYRYSVDEWQHYHHGGFAEANRLIAEANARFRSLHSKADGDYTMDEFEMAHADALLDAVVRGLGTAKHAGAFGGAEPFLAVWISDSGHRIMVESVQRLNSEAVADEFVAEFG